MPYSGFVIAGSQLAVNINGNYSNIPGIGSLDITGGGKPDVELTAISDTAKVFKGGMPDSGTADMSLWWDPTDAHHVFLKASYDNTASPVEAFKVFLKDQANTHVYFGGPVKTFGISLGGPDSGGSVKCSVKISGTIVINNN